MCSSLEREAVARTSTLPRVSSKCLWGPSSLATPRATGSSRRKRLKSQIFSPIRRVSTKKCTPFTQMKAMPQEYDRLHSEFENLHLVGTGEFSMVWKGSNKLDGLWYAIKVLKRPLTGEVYKNVIVNEAKILALLSTSGCEQ
eukprot:Filipodium_phascolosomae@DN865_c0_g1_i1.p2